jgi:hypothetical protein
MNTPTKLNKPTSPNGLIVSTACAERFVASFRLLGIEGTKLKLCILLWSRERSLSTHRQQP